MLLVLAAVYTWVILAVPPRRRLGLLVCSVLSGLAARELVKCFYAPPEGVHPLLIAMFAMTAAGEALCFAALVIGRRW